MVNVTNDLVIAWLKDAHALEEGIIKTLQEQVDVAADHPDVQQGIQQHLESTRNHAETVSSILSQMQESPSGLKEGMAAVGSKVQAMAMGSAKDDLVKIALNDYATEHMEIASYKALIVAVEAIGQPNFIPALQGILDDEIAMAGWLEQQLPLIVREAVAKGST
jgi:ferritin-like metal-binding protein YciE